MVPPLLLIQVRANELAGAVGLRQTRILADNAAKELSEALTKGYRIVGVTENGHNGTLSYHLALYP
jgi:hypothetical protein